ncbi:hypothetical protein AgCh_023676 [Apium graveolens]
MPHRFFRRLEQASAALKVASAVPESEDNARVCTPDSPPVDMDRANRPPDSWDPLSNSLAGTSSIRPERTGRALFGSAADYPAANNRSELSKGHVVQMYDDYSVPRGLCWLYAPREGERIYDTPGVPDGCGGCAVGVSEAAF